MFQEKKKIYRK